ncbi:MAG: DUF2231 domain-containing protein [Actinobacteria bacterium]|nr:DUF2231 domain-containing protein [Actinomycetota bacterium]
MRPSEIILHGFRGHPLHPPLTDASIGAYTVATFAVVAGWLGWSESLMVGTGFVATTVGLVLALPTAVTGLVDLLHIPRDVGARRTAWLHLGIMVSATVLFLVAAVLLYPGYVDGDVPTSAAVTTVVAFAVLTAGGWVGGALAYVHGIRVLNEPNASLDQALRPRAPEHGANLPS